MAQLAQPALQTHTTIMIFEQGPCRTSATLTVDGLVSSRTCRNGTVDVLGQTITELLYRERRALLDGLCLGGAAIASASTPSDGKASADRDSADCAAHPAAR
jgi:hypothetical protein